MALLLPSMKLLCSEPRTHLSRTGDFVSESISAFASFLCLGHAGVKFGPSGGRLMWPRVWTY